MQTYGDVFASYFQNKSCGVAFPRDSMDGIYQQWELLFCCFSGCNMKLLQ